MSNKYNHTKIETKWQEVWSKTELYKTDFDSNKKKYYNLVMFPYPSADFLHLGHAFNFSGADVYARYKKLNDFNVFEPIGYDAFGLPAENFAIKKGIHPREVIKGSIKHSEEQLNSWGCMFDWSKKINTSDPSYYKWTQWLFLKMYEKGLAYQKEAPVNWCLSCKTVLANEQVSDGECERCGSKVEIKNMKQWFFKITDYADRLINDLDKVDWPESSKAKQKNWIGRSEGTIVKFPIASVAITATSGSQSQNEKGDESLGLRQVMTIKEIEVFTTRVDTIFGCTYMVVAPEHPIIAVITTEKQKNEVDRYKAEAAKKSELERQEAKEKTGVFTGSYAINPFTGKEVPIWVADYVLYNYGTGAVMAVPAHDERDFEFAKKYEFKLRLVIDPYENSPELTQVPVPELSGLPDLEKTRQAKYRAIKKGQMYFTGSGILLDSEDFTGLTSEEAKVKMNKWLAEKNLGGKKINYRLRDWSFSRQRYWGAPIPVIYCEKCASTGSAQAGIIPVPEKDLPIELPEVKDFRPKGTGKGPLATNTDFVKTICPKCGGEAERETDTMDTFVCSSFYFLRYPSVGNDEEMMDKKITEKWLPVDMYVGGAEHVTMHLLYARFVTKALFDAGLLNFDEPFMSLRHQGMILGPDGKKMSKSKGNVIIPDTVVKDHGADAFRINILFMGGGEIVLIIFVFLLFFGSKAIPDIAKTLGKAMREFQKATNEIKREINESGGGLGDEIRDIKSTIQDARSNIQEGIKTHTSEIDKDIQEIKSDVTKGSENITTTISNETKMD